MTSRGHWGLALALAVAGSFWRWLYVVDLSGTMNGDDATVALMVRHILDGRHYAFFWGQDYMGTLEQYSIAAAARFLGLSDAVLRGVPMVYGVVYMVLFYPLGRLLGGKSLGLASLALAALCPPLLALWSSAPRGGYAEALALGQAIWVIALYLARFRPADWGAVWAVSLGLLAGLAFWTNLLTLLFAAPAAIVLAVRDRGFWRRRHLYVALATFLAGSLPFWIYNWGRGFATFAMFEGVGGEVSVLGNLARMTTRHVPRLLGLPNVFRDQVFLVPAWDLAAIAIVVAALAAGFVLAARRLGLSFWLGRRAPGEEASVIFLGILLAVYLTSRYATWNTPRFLVPAYTAIFPLLAGAALRAWTRSRAATALAVAVVASVVATGAWIDHSARAERPRHPNWDPQLQTFLEDLGIRHGYSNHEIGMVTTYRSGEEIILADWEVGRYPIEELDSWEPEALVVPGVAVPTREGLRGLSCDAKVRGFRRVTVFWDFECRVPPGAPIPRTEWRLAASDGRLPPENAVDGDVETRWGSARPQSPGMTFDVVLGDAREISGVRLVVGPYRNDFARGLRAEGSADGGRTWFGLGACDPCVPGLHVAEGRVHRTRSGTVELLFEPRLVDRVRLVQTQRHSLLDWSIAELEILALR